jgi:hypothetical protein
VAIIALLLLSFWLLLSSSSAEDAAPLSSSRHIPSSSSSSWLIGVAAHALVVGTLSTQLKLAKSEIPLSFSGNIFNIAAPQFRDIFVC